MAGERQQTGKQAETPEAEKAGREAVKEVEVSEDAESFPVERLIEDADGFLGVAPHVAAGALHGIRKKELTVEEAKAACKKWLAAPVKTEEA